MKLLLTVKGIDQLDNGLPARLELNERGAIIGRSPTVSWCLPDSTNHISSRHCEITFKNQQYSLNDISTNGTFVNGRQLSGPHILTTRDLIVIGQYQIQAEIEGAAPVSDLSDSALAGGWTGWDRLAQPAIAANEAPSAPHSNPFSDNQQNIISTEPVSQNSISDWGPANPSSNESSLEEWGSSPFLSEASPWESSSTPPTQSASHWSSEITEPTQTKSGDDIWGQIADGYVVDWARGGFGQTAKESVTSAWNPTQSSPQPTQTSALWSPAAAINLASQPTQLLQEVKTSQAPITTVPPETPQVLNEPNHHFHIFIEALGLNPSDIKSLPEESLATAAFMLSKLIGGMVVMLEARARAKSQMGAQGTSLQFDGNNPLKFARTPEQALVQLLNPKERGFMNPERAIEDAFVDLQSHQMATLKAMQGALKSTLERFSPNEIRKRVDSKGIMSKLFPDTRDAALWKAYEKEFSGVVQGSDEAFMDVFSKEFRRAYEDLTSKR